MTLSTTFPPFCFRTNLSGNVMDVQYSYEYRNIHYVSGRSDLYVGMEYVGTASTAVQRTNLSGNIMNVKYSYEYRNVHYIYGHSDLYVGMGYVGTASTAVPQRSVLCCMYQVPVCYCTPSIPVINAAALLRLLLHAMMLCIGAVLY